VKRSAAHWKPRGVDPHVASSGRWRVDLAAHLVTRVGLAQLMTGVWGPGYERRTNYLRFHMARLRGKLEGDPAHPRHLLTEHGMGYRYQP
jgi:DNA-binding response OmpR family regulator